MGLPPFKVEVAVPWEVEEWSWPLPWWGVKVLEEIISTRQDTLAILNTKRLGPKNVNIEQGALAYVTCPGLAVLSSSPDYFHRVRTRIVLALLFLKHAAELCERQPGWLSGRRLLRRVAARRRRARAARP